MMNTTRFILLFLIAIGLSLTLGACQGDRRTASQDEVHGDLEKLDPGGALVVYWHTLTASDEDRLLEMIDDFNAGNEWGITVVGEYQGNLQTLYERVIAGIPSDQLPGLVMTDGSLAASYVAQDVAVALSPYLESENWGFTQAELEDFFPSTLVSEKLLQFNDQIYSFPSCRSLQVLYYNVDWLKELDYDAPPQTWNAFREMACAASNPAEGLFGFEMGMDSSIFTSLLATQDIPLLNPETTAYTLGGEQGRAALQFLQDLINDGCALWETENGLLADFSVGKTLFAIDSTVGLPAYQREVMEGPHFALSVSVLPHTTHDPLLGAYGASLTILRTSPREQLAAWLFIKWLAEPAQQARWSQHAACFPIRRSAFEDMEAYLKEYPQYQLASELLEQDWSTEPNVTAYATCRAEIGRMLYAVTAGESVEHWFNETQSLCNQTLAGEEK